jgi:DNA-binding FrmR family transcriptional regulator
MTHTVREKQKLRNRVRRIRGQVEAVERVLEAEGNCAQVMHLLAASGGAMRSLLAEVLEDHVREHVLGASGTLTRHRRAAGEELIDIIHTYLK